MTSRIRQIGDPILRRISSPIALERVVDTDVQKLIDHMQNILNGIQAISSENGNALSAPQVGQAIRLILLRINGEFCAMINPEFTPLSEEKFEFEEECFSLYDKRAMIMRYRHINLNYVDRNGNAQSKDLSGEHAALVQHEIDHLDGVLFVDHVDDDKLHSIDTVLADDPSRLSQVKDMMAYMAADV